MPDLSISVDGAEAVTGSLIPQLRFRLHIVESSGARIDSVALACQIQIEATRRPYESSEREALLDLFGAPTGWGRTLRTMLWTHASLVVPSFAGETFADLMVPCSYDLSLASAKYFFALEDGVVPLSFQFSGSVFYRDDDDGLQTAPIPWTKEARVGLPVSTWRRLMEEEHGDTAWICLRRDVFERLYRLKARRGLPTWEQLLEALLDAAEGAAGRPAGSTPGRAERDRLPRAQALP